MPFYFIFCIFCTFSGIYTGDFTPKSSVGSNFGSSHNSEEAEQVISLFKSAEQPNLDKILGAKKTNIEHSQSSFNYDLYGIKKISDTLKSNDQNSAIVQINDFVDDLFIETPEIQQQEVEQSDHATDTMDVDTSDDEHDKIEIMLAEFKENHKRRCELIDQMVEGLTVIEKMELQKIGQDGPKSRQKVRNLKSEYGKMKEEMARGNGALDTVLLGIEMSLLPIFEERKKGRIDLTKFSAKDAKYTAEILVESFQILNFDQVSKRKRAQLNIEDAMKSLIENIRERLMWNDPDINGLTATNWLGNIERCASNHPKFTNNITKTFAAANFFYYFYSNLYKFGAQNVDTLIKYSQTFYLIWVDIGVFFELMLKEFQDIAKQ